MNDWIDRLRQRHRPAPWLPPHAPVWIFGCGSFGRDLARACAVHEVPVRGFVQTQPTQSQVDGLPVLGWADLKPQDLALPLLIGIHNYATALDALALLARNAGCRQVLAPWDYYPQFERELGWRYWLASPETWFAHAEALRRTHARLADAASRTCLERVLAFRLGQDLPYASERDAQAQYFNPLTLTALQGRSLRYLDGGAFDGDSLRQLMALAAVEQAWLFEPDPGNHTQLCRRVRELKVQAHCLPLGLSDRCALLRFNAGQGAGAHVGEDGADCIVACTVDAVLGGAALDLIKLDIEGAEAQALQGASDTLRAHAPVLAVSAYHRPEDLWQLPDLLADLCPQHRHYLRQHACNSFDLVLYAVPPR